jgi:hypothetical protein
MAIAQSDVNALVFGTTASIAVENMQPFGVELRSK